jgi:hypothetical protein
MIGLFNTFNNYSQVSITQLDLTSSEDLTQLDVQNNTLYCRVLWIHYTSLFFQSNWVRSSEMLSPTPIGKTSIALSWCNVFVKSIVFFCHPIYCITCDCLYFYEYITSSACYVGSPDSYHCMVNSILALMQMPCYLSRWRRKLPPTWLPSRDRANPLFSSQPFRFDFQSRKDKITMNLFTFLCDLSLGTPFKNRKAKICVVFYFWFRRKEVIEPRNKKREILFNLFFFFILPFLLINYIVQYVRSRMRKPNEGENETEDEEQSDEVRLVDSKLFWREHCTFFLLRKLKHMSDQIPRAEIFLNSYETFI